MPTSRPRLTDAPRMGRTTHAPRYTAAKHLLTELKATLSDLQEQMESSDRIAHQSEVRHMNHARGYHLHCIALHCIAWSTVIVRMASVRAGRRSILTLLGFVMYSRARLSFATPRWHLRTQFPPARLSAVLHMLPLHRCRQRLWTSCARTYRGGWKVSKTTTTSKRTHWRMLLTSG